jgi:hypothetical protein
MNIADLSRILRRTAAVFRSGGAAAQAETLDAVQDLLQSSGDATVEDFVLATREALKGLESTSPEEIVQKLRALGTDQVEFEHLLTQLGEKQISKEKATAVASLYTGARESAYKSKPKALAAIRQKFEDEVYHTSKAKLNERVTPW